MNIPEDQLKSTVLGRRLGDYLLNQNLLSEAQLEEAIEYQCIYGGKLGTSLVELGYVHEDLLAQILSQQLRLHYIKPELLMNVPAEILQLVPEKIALRYKVVPYHIENKRLYLAMNDASNLAEIDELSFQLNQVIVPLAVPEVRLMLALKQHYGLTLSPRFETLASQIKKRGLAEKKQANFVPVEPSDKTIEDWPLLGDEGSEAEDISPDAYFSDATSTAEISLTSLCQQLATASERNDIARALVNYLGQEFIAAGIFVVRPTSVSGWLARCKDVEVVDFAQYIDPLQQGSVLKLVVDNRSHYLGQILEPLASQELIGMFSAAPPSALVVPILVRERVVSILYVQDHLENLEKRFAELQSLVSKAEMAFMLLIMKNKILTI